MRFMKPFRFLAFPITVLSITIFGTPTQSSWTSAAMADEPLPVTAKADKATVRIDANGSYVGVGIVVSASGHVLSSVQAAGSWRYAKFTVGDARTPASVIDFDESHGLALLRATAPLGVEPVTVASTRAQKNAAVSLVSYRQISSEPPMVSRRKDVGSVVNPTYVGDSAGTLDLRDLEIVRLRGQEQSTPYPYSPVISAKTGELEGFVIGFMRRPDASDLLVMPASVIVTFLQAKKVPLP
jgi:hypothetical protein